MQSSKRCWPPEEAHDRYVTVCNGNLRSLTLHDRGHTLDCSFFSPLAVEEVTCISTGVGDASTTVGAFCVLRRYETMPPPRSSKPAMPPRVPPMTAPELSLPPLSLPLSAWPDPPALSGSDGDGGAAVTTVTTRCVTAGTERMGAPMKVLAADL